MKNRIDLHSHTNRSDGSLSPKELVMLAKEKGLEAIAITDHDTILALKEMNYNTPDLEIVPGVEISIKNEEERKLVDVHVLGYFIECENRNLSESLDRLNASKRRWLYSQIKILDRNGIPVSENEVKRIAGSAVPRRPHVWKALEESKQGNISREDFFGRTSFGGDLYVKRDFEISLEDSIVLIRKAGGIPVLAHPGFYETDVVVAEAVSAGIEGLEVKYFYERLGKKKSADIARHVNELAGKYGLLKTGGSDFHDEQHGAMLGSVHVPQEYLEKMKRCARK